MSLIERLRQLARRQRQYGASPDEKIDVTCDLTIDDLDEAATRLEAMQAEIDRLRQIISDCATALDSGAMIRPDATLEFMGYLPDEIRLRVQKLKAASLDRQGK